MRSRIGMSWLGSCKKGGPEGPPLTFLALAFTEDLYPSPKFDPPDQTLHGDSSKCSRNSRAVATAREIRAAARGDIPA